MVDRGKFLLIHLFFVQSILKVVRIHYRMLGLENLQRWPKFDFAFGLGLLRLDLDQFLIRYLAHVQNELIVVDQTVDAGADSLGSIWLQGHVEFHEIVSWRLHRLELGYLQKLVKI